MERAFADVSILMAASYREDAGCQQLWKLQGVTVITSFMAFYSAQINITDAKTKDREAKLRRLQELINSTELVADPPEGQELPEDIELPEHCRKVFLAAIHAEATHFITGDVRHYEELLGQEVAGVRVQLVGAFLQTCSAAAASDGELTSDSELD